MKKMFTRILFIIAAIFVLLVTLSLITTMFYYHTNKIRRPDAGICVWCHDASDPQLYLKD